MHSNSKLALHSWLQNEFHSFKPLFGASHNVIVPIIIIMTTVVEVLGHVVQTNIFKNPFCNDTHALIKTLTAF